MSTPAATSRTRLSRRAICAVLALALGLACAVLGVAVSSDMSDMSARDGVSATDGPGQTTLVASGTATEAGAPSATSLVSSHVASMCDHACAGLTGGELCTLVAALVVTSVLALLVAASRTTFVGLLARVGRCGLLRRRLRRRTPWLAPSPVSLCVLRV